MKRKPMLPPTYLWTAMITMLALHFVFPVKRIIPIPWDLLGALPLALGVGRNPKELVRQVKAFQHVRATGEVAPSGWEPGQVTLKPGPALVGRVWEVWKP